MEREKRNKAKKRKKKYVSVICSYIDKYNHLHEKYIGYYDNYLSAIICYNIFITEYIIQNNYVVYQLRFLEMKKRDVNKLKLNQLQDEDIFNSFSELENRYKLRYANYQLKQIFSP